MNDIIKFSKNINLIINDDTNFIKRNSEFNKLNLKNTIYASVLALKCTSISSVVCDLNIDSVVNISKNSLIKKRNNDTTHICIKKMNDNIIKMIYDTNNNYLNSYNFGMNSNNMSYYNNYGPKDKSLYINRTSKRFIACDGTQINLNKSLINNVDVKVSKNEKYGVGILSSMYDVLNEIPINYNLTKCNENEINKKKVNETNGFLDQLSYLSSNDIVIFDRWYYSESLIEKLNENKIGYIFRMKSNSNFFKKMSLGKSKFRTFNNINIQLFKYKIKNEYYYILTSILDKISIKEIKALYNKRWKIETDNKKIKYDILFNEIRAKKHNSLMVDIESIRFMSIISSFIGYLCKYIKSKTKLKMNTKICLDILHKKLLRLMLFGEKYVKICYIFNIVCSEVVVIVVDRVCTRVCVKPKSKWCNSGSRTNPINNDG